MVKQAMLIADPQWDQRLMAAALRLGRRNRGRTHPSPAVGALIVRFDGGEPVIVGRGATPAGAGGLAVAVALSAAGEAARGATAYLTLEPGLHNDDGTSSTDALIAAGVARVVVALEDPRPGRTRAGQARLREAGVEVTAGVLGEEARRDHAGFLMRISQGRPFVTLKLAVSADGMIGRKSGERMLVSGHGAFEHLQRLRLVSDATMVGIGTVLANDPRLIVRVPSLARLSPIRIVLDTEARMPPDCALLKSLDVAPLWVLVRPDADRGRRERLAAAGADVLEVEGGSGGLDIAAVLRLAGERGINDLLVEGGARVAASLVSRGFADAVVLYRAPVVVGPDGVRALAGGALSTIDRSPRYRIVDEVMLGEDRMVRFERKS